jgi:hypothetical protein
VCEYAPSLVTGPDGRFLFRGLHGCSGELTLRAQGYCEAQPSFVSGDERMRILLLRPGAVSGVVVRQDGTPAAGACVDLGSNRGHARTEITADALGRFEIRGLVPRKQEILATLDRELHGSVTVVPREGETTTDLRLVVRPRVRSFVRVRVTDESGRPVPGARLTENSAYVLARTAADGTATIELDGPPREARFYVEPEADRSPPLCETVILCRSAPSAEQAPLADAVLHEAVRVRLAARATGGAPLPDADAAFDGGDAVACDADRSWLVDPTDEYTVIVRAPGYLPSTTHGWRPRGGVIEAELRPSAAARVRVLDPQGAPVTAVFAKFAKTGTPSWWGMETEVQCGADGSFLLEDLEEGEGTLCLSQLGGSGVAVEVRTVSGEVADAGTVTLAPPVALTGRIVDEESRPLGGVFVWFPPGRGTYSRADGTFRTDALASFELGPLFIRKDGFGTVRLRVATAELGDIVMSPPGALEIEVSGPGPLFASVEVCAPDAVAPADVESTYGRPPYRITDLAPGRYVARLLVDERVLEREVGIAAGETTRVTFVLDR